MSAHIGKQSTFWSRDLFGSKQIVLQKKQEITYAAA